MAFEKINADDTLNQGRIKINNILNNVDEAVREVSQLSESITENYSELKEDISDALYSDEYDRKLVVASSELISGSYKIFIPLDKFVAPVAVKLYAPNISDGTINTYYCNAEKGAIGAISITFSNHYAILNLKSNYPYVRLPASSIDEFAYIVEQTTGIQKSISDLDTKLDIVGDKINEAVGNEYIAYTAIKDNDILNIPTSQANDYDGSGLIVNENARVQYPKSYANKSIRIISRDDNKSAIDQYDFILDDNAILQFKVASRAHYYTFYLDEGEQIGIYSYDTLKNRVNASEKKLSSLGNVGISFENDSIVALEGDSFRDCVFINCSISPENNTHFDKCDFVNTIINTNKPVVGMNVSMCRFIGRNARIQISEIADCIIDGNDFMISDEVNYPDAIPKTKGEFSRNIFVYSMNRCKIINNFIRIGRTGICCLGNNDRLNAENVINLSSCDNIIKGNHVEGIGEEHISFDGGAFLDVCKIENVNVSLKDVDTEQMANGSDESINQIKKVAIVSIDVKTELVGTHNFPDTKHIKKFRNVLNGMYAVNAKNSKYYPLIDMSISNTSLDTDGTEYSADGKYTITVEIPTIYSNLNPIDSTKQQDVIDKIKRDWTENDVISITSIQARNIISDNIIEGIGTDTISNVSDMGGIVLYGTCINNVIANNTLRQKRIWLISLNNKSGQYMSKMKIQSYNNIIGNVLYDTAISLNSIGGLIGFYSGKICRGNILSANIVIGTNDVAGIMVDNFTDTKLIGNNARHYRIRNCDGLKLVANNAETYSESGSYFYGNTNVTADNTDDIQTGFQN